VETSEASLNYVEISLSVLRRFNRALQFDVYVKRTENDFTKIFKQGDSIDWERVKLYENKGIKFFFVSEKDYQLYTLHVERLGENLTGFGKDFTADEAADLLKELANHTLNEITTNLKVDERAAANSSNVVEAGIASLAKDPKNFVRVMKLMVNQTYSLKHALAVSMLSVLLARQAGVESEANLRVIGLGGFLHDIGESQLTFDPESEKNLTAEQRKELWRHPELGKQMIDGVRSIRSEVGQIILQHHEQPNGHGYPNGLKGGEIYYPAKIVAVADTFAAMISRRQYRESLNISEALMNMKEMSGKYDRQLLEAFSKMMSPVQDN
jgi:putative nucleotidyltransferase with HDIG domain